MISERTRAIVAAFASTLVLVACAGDGEPTPTTAIISFQASDTTIDRGSAFTLSWQAVNPGVGTDERPACSITRRAENEPAGEPFGVACTGSLTEVPPAPESAGYVRYQLNVLKNTVDPLDAYITSVVTVTVLPAAGATWSVEPQVLVFLGEPGGAQPPAASFELSNVGGTSSSFEVASGSIVTVSPETGELAAGSSTTMSVSVAACMSEGTTTSFIDVSGGGSEARVSVARECGPPPADTGYLQVTVLGLPDGAYADIDITNGSGVFYYLPFTILLPDVPVGGYEYTAFPVTFEDVEYAPSPSSGTLEVFAGATTSLTITYE